MRTILNASTGSPVPVTLDLNVQPLMHMGQPVLNGRGVAVMNDQWIYVSDRNGSYSINVNRAMYCEKMYLSQITIQKSIGENMLMDDDLKKFVDKVSDRIVFKKGGKWYRIYLRKINRRKFTIAKVVPYIAEYNPNARIFGCYAHEICIDWRNKWYVR